MLKVVKAEEKHSEKLKKFLVNQPMLTGPPLDLVVHRNSSFFDRYRFQSDDFVTLMIVDGRNRIHAVLSFVFKEVFLNGELTTVAYATDLRISNNREVTIKWPQLLMPIAQEELKKRKSVYTFSLMNYSQKQAFNALLRPRGPRSTRSMMPRYHLYREFDLVSIHGQFPFQTFLSTIKMSHAKQSDFDPLVEYLYRKTYQRPLYPSFNPEIFEEHLKRWSELSLEDFLLAKDTRGRIIGCTAPWNNSHIQCIEAHKYSEFGETLRFFFNSFSFTKYLKPLPKTGHFFSTKLLTHLFADNTYIFSALLKQAHKESLQNEILIYPHDKKVPATLPPKGLITTTLPFALYCLVPSNKPTPDFLQNYKSSPHLDITLI